MRNRKAFYLDLVERVGWTFVQAGLAAWIALGEKLEENALEIALTAGGIAVAKVFISNKLPWTADDSGSSLPAELDPPSDGHSNEAGATDVMTIAAVVVIIVGVIWLLDRFID